MARVHTPVAGFQGVISGVQFVDGKADVDDGTAALHYFTRHGYEVLPDSAEPVPGAKPPAAPGERISYENGQPRSTYAGDYDGDGNYQLYSDRIGGGGYLTPEGIYYRLDGSRPYGARQQRIRQSDGALRPAVPTQCEGADADRPLPPLVPTSVGWPTPPEGKGWPNLTNPNWND